MSKAPFLTQDVLELGWGSLEEWSHSRGEDLEVFLSRPFWPALFLKLSASPYIAMMDLVDVSTLKVPRWSGGGGTRLSS